MYNPKDNYNNPQSVLVYTGKKGLTKSEESIFSLFSFKKEVKILDLGCGGGRTTAALYNKGFHNIVGVDFAENLIEGAKKEYPELADKFFVGDATKLSDFQDDEFDIVFFSFNGIDYIPDAESRIQAYREIYRVLKEEGMYIFSSHNKYCFPINRLLLKIQLQNIHRWWSDYWWAPQTFGKMLTYFSTERKLENELHEIGFNKICVIPNTTLLYPFLDAFPYYIYQKPTLTGR